MEKCGTAATGTFNAYRATQFMTITFTFHIQSKRNFSTTAAIGNFSIRRKDGRCGNVANFWHYRGCYNLQVISRLVMQCNGNGLSELWQSKVNKLKTLPKRILSNFNLVIKVSSVDYSSAFLYLSLLSDSTSYLKMRQKYPKCGCRYSILNRHTNLI